MTKSSVTAAPNDLQMTLATLLFTLMAHLSLDARTRHSSEMGAIPYYANRTRSGFVFPGAFTINEGRSFGWTVAAQRTWLEKGARPQGACASVGLSH